MNANIYKAIFRLDYPISYRIVDRLGEYLEFITNKTNEKPFTESNGALSMANHSIAHNSKIGDDVFTLNLDVKSCDAVIEFPKGLEISKLNKCPLFSLADEVIEKLEDGTKFKYDRIGFRVFLIIEETKLDFNQLRDYVWNCNKTFGDAIIGRYEQREDIGLVFEASAKDDEKIRYALGPYKEKESQRYFVLKNDVKEGLIFDIDIWQNKISLPKLKLVKSISSYQKTYDSIIIYTIKQMEGILKYDTSKDNKRE
jgi:hypothetical protein